MALSGKLDADFAEFYDACKRAVVELKSFDTETKTVEKTLGRMTDEFSGRRIQTEAALMAEAVERVGGVSTLTEKELARVGNTAAEAAAKMRALGQDVLKGIEDLAKHAKTADSAFTSMKATVTDLALGFAAMFSARAIFNFAGQILDTASALQDLSNQTQMSVEEIQVLAGAMSEFGVDQDTLAKGLFTLSRKIAGGDDSIDVALRKMGLSLAEVAGQNGEELFLTIERGLSTLKGSLRDEVAATLFGSKLGMAMAGAANDIDATVAKARELTTVIGTDAVGALDTYGETIERAEKNLLALAANLIGPVAAGFNVLFDAATKGAKLWDLAMGLLPKGLGLVGTGVEGLATAIDHANIVTEENAAKTRAAAGEHAAWQGPLNQTAAQIKASADAATKAAAETAKFNDAMMELSMSGSGWVTVLNTIDGTVVEAVKHYLNLGVSQKALADAYGLTEYQVRAVAAAMKDSVAAADLATAAAKRQKEIIEEITRQTNEQVIAKFKATQADKEFADTELKAAQAAEEWFTKTADGAAKVEPAMDKATKATGVFMNQLHMLVSDPMLAGFFDSSGIGATLYGGGTSGITPEEAAAMAAGQFIQRAGVGTVARPPGRAGGGPVSAGTAYVVGERGPELFIPSQNGGIASGGGAVAAVTNHIYVNGTAEEVARKVSAEILRTVMAGTKVR